MLTQIDVVYGEVADTKALALPIRGLTTKDSLQIRKVTGLNSPSADLFMGEYSRDGGIYQGRRVGSRNVVMAIDLNPNPALGQTVDGLRSLLYKTFMDPLLEADYVQLILHDDILPNRYILGYAESVETDIFDIETLAQVSMLCPDPYIRDVTETNLASASGGWTQVPFTYEGSAKTGFKVRVRASVGTNQIVLTNNSRSMVVNHAFLPGDLIEFNTNRGERDIRLINADGTTSSPLIAKLENTSPWLELHSQANRMTISAGAVIQSLSYRGSYWGV